MRLSRKARIVLRIAFWSVLALALTVFLALYVSWVYLIVSPLIGVYTVWKARRRSRSRVAR